MKKKNQLAIKSGVPIINYKFKKYSSIGNEELKAVKRVIKKKELSSFLAGNLEGGLFVKKFENYLEKFYKVKHAITVNSWTSGLICAVGALDIAPGDEIITTTWSMSASAISIIHWNAIPVFADIDPNTYCIDPISIKKKITKKTKAILVVDIFGRGCDIPAIKKIIKGTNIKIICDSAQSPYSIYKNKIVGTQGDIGGYSLNCHKLINTGEGGVLVTNNDYLARRMKLLRNHAENFRFFKKKRDLNNMIGFNFRMGEIEAAIGFEQYKKLKKIIIKRNIFIKILINKIKYLKGLYVPNLKNIFDNNFYIFPIRLDLKKIKYSRKYIIKCLSKEGIQGLNEGYVNIHKLPLFKNKIAYGKKGFPWSAYNNKITYQNNLCPVAEYLQKKTFIGFEVCLFDITKKDVIKISDAFIKVWKCLKI
jgi:dTDP-4-amino-4,6-dideoxygalactose transaminase